MKRNLLTLLILFLLISVLTIPVFAATQGTKTSHWSQKFLDELALEHDISSIFEGKDLNAYITIQDFQNAIRLFIDEEYAGTPDSVAREAIVYEFAQLWASKTGNNLDEIMTIKMLIYADTDKIDAKYNHAITVAYMKDIARGSGQGIFDPKTSTTYGELATLVYFTDKAISKSNEPEISPIAKGRLETRVSHEIRDGKVAFDFELMSHYTKPLELVFSSGQQFEVTITNESGTEVYRYSDGRAFTMALVYKTINPGEAFKWHDEWDMTNKDGEKLTSGNYKAVIKILALSESDEKIDDSELTAPVEFTTD